MTTKELKKSERHERAIAIVRQMTANKKAAEQEAIEEYKTNPVKQALVAELDRKNAERGTPVVRLRIHE
jgi:anti-sigma factor RsiW